MGLMIHSLDLLSKEAEREYFIYLLDYGWDEPIANTIRANFSKMADFASKNDSAIIMGVGKKELTKFSVQKQLKKGIGNRLVDSITLQPSFAGIGLNLKKLFESE